MAGNLSARLTTQAILITSRGAHKGHLGRGDVVELSLDADEGEAAVASTEFPFHRACYRARSDVGAVVHTHAPALVAAGIRGVDIADTLPEVALATGSIAVVPLLESGSPELGEAVGHAVARGAGVVLLERHGAVAVGKDLQEAVHRMELAELAAYTALLAIHGKDAVDVERVVLLSRRVTRDGDGGEG